MTAAPFGVFPTADRRGGWDAALPRMLRGGVPDGAVAGRKG